MILHLVNFLQNNINNEFNRENNIYVINPNFWALNFSEGFIEMEEDVLIRFQKKIIILLKLYN